MIVVGMENAESNIHSTAIVHPNAKLGKDVIVGPGAVIGEHVEIGDGTQIGAHVVIGGWTTIGKRCEIYPNASIGLEPQDLKFKGEKSYCNIGDETVIREFELLEKVKKHVWAIIACFKHVRMWLITVSLATMLL